MFSLKALTLALTAATTALSQSTGCGGAGLQSGQASINVNGANRDYILNVPSTDGNTPLKLIFGFHWLGGSMNDVANGWYGLEGLANNGAVFVAPNGFDAGWANSGGQDIAFVDALVEHITGNLCIDEEQIFATGFSYGGAMSHSVACSRPGVFRAVSVIAGATLSGCDGGQQPVAYLGIHGVVDSVLNIDAGRQLRDQWIATNGCQQQDAPEPQPGTGDFLKTEYQCSNAPVTWIAHSGDHVADPNSNGNYWAPGETWEFFNAA
ncbi:alpha/beta-hydrolase [Sarocladium strictum]